MNGMNIPHTGQGITSSLSIASRKIGPGQPVYIIAEMSGNHGQSYEEAVRIVHAMKNAGADAVKIQTYTADTITIDSKSPEFIHQGSGQWAGRNLYDLYREAYTPWEWQPHLKREAENLGMDFFSSPFDPSSVDFLESIGVPAYKIASFELVDIPLIRKVARTGKPVIMSTGMGSVDEIQAAVDAVYAERRGNLALLKCTSAYPATPESMNLATIADMAVRFKVPIGLSDHSLALSVPVAAIALGACIIEKHFTMSRAVKGPDNSFSLEPDEFRDMVNSVRIAERAVGRVSYEPTEKESESRIFRRSLYVVTDMTCGELFTERTVRSIRPANGLPPSQYERVLASRAACDIKAGTPLAWNLVAKE